MALVTFKLLDRKTDENSFFLHQDGTKDFENKLNFTNQRGVLNPFWVVENGSRKYFRYIEGCSIFDPAEQDKQKIVSNFQTSTILFSKGSDIIVDDEKMKPLVDFLTIHPHNPGSKYHKEDHDSVFYRFDPKKVVDIELAEATKQDEALLLFAGISKNKEKMSSLALLFAETKDLQTEEEIYLGLRAIAKNKSEDFIVSIANKQNEILSQVLKAQTAVYGIVGKDAKGFFYEADKSLLFETVTKKKEEANSELVTYLMSAEGDIHFRNLLIKIQQKEVELQAPSGITE